MIITAIMLNPDYLDLEQGVEYEIDRLYSKGYIKLKNSNRRYRSSSFHILLNGEKISYTEAYKRQQFEMTMRKFNV